VGAGLAAAIAVANSCSRAPASSDRPAVGPSANTADAGHSGESTTAQLAPLPAVDRQGAAALEQLIARRRSVRELAGRPLERAELSQLAWAAQGLSEDGTRRNVPSAGALYPLELRIVCSDGLFRYHPAGHALSLVRAEDLRPALSAAALGQPVVAAAPCTFALSGVVERTARKYGERAHRFIAMEAGHAAQNLLLQAEARGLGGVPIGGFEEERVSAVLGLAEGEEPLYLIPVGHPAR
jgi:SagB-type dehydrogenase family enzyme